MFHIRIGSIKCIVITIGLFIAGQIHFITRVTHRDDEFHLLANDIEAIHFWANEFNLNFTLIDPLLLAHIQNATLAVDAPSLCGQCESTAYFACDSNDFKTVDKIFQKLKGVGFDGEMLWMNETNITVGLVVRRVSTFVLVFLHTKEGYTWWIGASETALNNDRFKILKEEKLLDKFETSPLMINKLYKRFFYPKRIESFLDNLKEARYVACDMKRAEDFHRKYGKDTSRTARKFRHKSWKLISRVKQVLDYLRLTFWISSGTCLGFYRECDIIAHSKDVDIGMFARDYRLDIVQDFERRGIQLTHVFGEANDSLELSFVDESRVKLDVFFFYEEKDMFWNGGTQARTGKKFKYVFPKFELCWTLFLDLKVRVPCDTETYVEANYGPSWFEPIKEWDWKKSPFNVRENGYWPETKRKFAV